MVLWAPNTFDGDRFIIVSKGESFRAVADSLENAGILRSRVLFDVAGRMLGLTTKMQIGKYRFRSGSSNKDILENLRNGMTLVSITVTIPEGLRASRHARIFGRALGIDTARFMSFVRDTTFVRSLGIASNSLEGYLLPNTYEFYWQTDEIDIIKSMVNEFWNVFNDTLQARAESLQISIHNIVTLASIVEAETAVDTERAIVAGVYYNRLRKRMRLEADPTIQYILEDGPRRLKYSDLRRESPYNTYRNYGLPPGPINNPGRAAIVASLYPLRHKYLFFVANGEGGHAFTKSFAEHRLAIQSFRRKRIEQQQQIVTQEDTTSTFR
jgi:UPF0755 protein